MNDKSLSGKDVACNPPPSSSSVAFRWVNLMLDVEQDIERENDNQDYNIYQQQRLAELQQELLALINVDDPNHHDDIINIEAGRLKSNETTLVFLDWFKKNKDIITAEDLRRIKLKRYTVECATRHLGGGQERMRKLLDLILQWVEINHHNKRRAREVLASSPQPYQFREQQPQNLTTNFINSSSMSSPIQQIYQNSFPFQSDQWTTPELQSQPGLTVAQPSIIAPSKPIGGGYIDHDTYNNSFGEDINNPYFRTPNQSFPILESSLQPVLMPVPPPLPSSGPHVVSSSGVKAVSSTASVTKEARRRRMGMYQRISLPFRYNNQQPQRRNHARVLGARSNENQQFGCSRR